MIGLTLAQYRIDAELGRGGMGIVYRAHDTKLDRTVALKVLPASALGSDDDRTRFLREAKAAAQLSHPNVCHVYQVDEAVPLDADGQRVTGQDDARLFIAMEYIDGETLGARIAKGPLKLAEAVSIAAQVAEALRAAHAKEIVHRDIKSANVMLTKEGVAKVLDFGLAKTNQSTMLTRQGSTVGTAAYMSPEQARGQEVDGRSDLYSLGTMLYEMVSGRLPFGGDYEQAVVYGILNENPEPLTAVRTGVPMGLEWIVNKLMAKEPRHRYQTAADLVADLETVDLSGSGMSRRSMAAVSGSMAGATARPGRTAFPAWGWAAIAGALLLGAAGAWLGRPVPDRAPSAVVSFPLEIESSLDRTGRRAVAISPDGRWVAYNTAAGPRLQPMDGLGTSTLLVDLESAGIRVRDLFFSPDSRWLAFEDDQNERLMRVSLAGGSPVRIADLPGTLQGAAWAASGDIYLGLQELGIGRIVQGSGVVEIVVGPDSLGSSFQKPSLLPDGHSMLYTQVDAAGTVQARIYDLGTGQDRLVVEAAAAAVYVSSGHLLFWYESTVYANPFDPAASDWADLRTPLVEGVMGGLTGVAQFDLSQDGTFVAARGEATSGGYRLALVAPEGSFDVLPGEERVWGWPDVNPAGTHLVAETVDAGVFDLWTVDVRTGETVRLTSNGRSTNGVWGPDGNRIAHTDMDGFMLLRYLDDAARVDTLLHAFGRPTSWSSDGRYLFYEESQNTSTAARTLKVLDLETGEDRPFPADADGEQDGNISPDGHWLAFEKASGGVYVVRFPSGGDPRLVSRDVGLNPRWSSDGGRLYYQAGRRTVGMSEFDPQTGVPQLPEIMQLPAGMANLSDFAVLPDGKILVRTEGWVGADIDSALPIPSLKFVIGFHEVLRERVGSGS